MVPLPEWRDKMRGFHVTQDELIPNETAEGEDLTYTESYSFVRADDTPACVDGVWGEAAGAIKAECALTLREALRLFGDRYGEHGLEDGGFGTTFYQADWSQNYRTGEQSRRAFHMPDSITEASRQRVLRLLIGK